MHVTVTKITNGYLVTTFSDDGVETGSRAVVKNAVGNVPAKAVGLAITSVLGKISVTKKVKRTRKTKGVAPEAAAAVA